MYEIKKLEWIKDGPMIWHSYPKDFTLLAFRDEQGDGWKFLGEYYRTLEDAQNYAQKIFEAEVMQYLYVRDEP